MNLSILQRTILASVLVVLVMLSSATAAGATVSIVGADPETGEVGVAIASCVSGALLETTTESSELITLVPGVGAGVSQAAFNSDAPPEIARLLGEGASPQDIVDRLVSDSFDRNSNLRQHAVVTVDGSAAGFTGSKNNDVAIDLQQPYVSVQGNILVSESVAIDALAAFESGDGRLADRLVDALVAASDVGGDSRCDDQTALFAHVAVAQPGDDPLRPSVLLWVTVNRGSGDNPIQLLASEFRAGNDQVSTLRGTATLIDRVIQFIPVLTIVVPLGLLLAIVLVIRRAVLKRRSRSHAAVSK